MAGCDCLRLWRWLPCLRDPSRTSTTRAMSAYGLARTASGSPVVISWGPFHCTATARAPNQTENTPRSRNTKGY